MKVVLDEPESFFLDDLSAFIWDTVLLHDAVVLSRPDYDFEFNQYFWRRNGRPLRQEDRARVGRVRHESPFLLEVAGTLSAIVVVGKSLEWLHNWPERRQIIKGKANQAKALDDQIEPSRRLKQAQVEKAEDEARLARIEREDAETRRGDRTLLILPNQPPLELPPEAGPVLEDERSQQAAAQTIRRLARSPLRIGEVTIRRGKGRRLPPPR